MSQNNNHLNWDPYKLQSWSHWPQNQEMIFTDIELSVHIRLEDCTPNDNILKAAYLWNLSLYDLAPKSILYTQ